MEIEEIKRRLNFKTEMPLIDKMVSDTYYTIIAIEEAIDQNLPKLKKIWPIAKKITEIEKEWDELLDQKYKENIPVQEYLELEEKANTEVRKLRDQIAGVSVMEDAAEYRVDFRGVEILFKIKMSGQVEVYVIHEYDPYKYKEIQL